MMRRNFNIIKFNFGLFNSGKLNYGLFKNGKLNYGLFNNECFPPFNCVLDYSNEKYYIAVSSLNPFGDCKTVCKLFSTIYFGISIIFSLRGKVNKAFECIKPVTDENRL
jgi:hypothetical protein